MLLSTTGGVGAEITGVAEAPPTNVGTRGIWDDCVDGCINGEDDEEVDDIG